MVSRQGPAYWGYGYREEGTKCLGGRDGNLSSRLDAETLYCKIRS